MHKKMDLITVARMTRRKGICEPEEIAIYSFYPCIFVLVENLSRFYILFCRKRVAQLKQRC